MAELKVKTEFIGACTSVNGIGQIKITQEHAPMLARAGRWELLEGEAPNVKKLVPVESVETPIKKKKSKRDAGTN